MKHLCPKLIARPWGGHRLYSMLSRELNVEKIGEAWIHDGMSKPKIILKWIDAHDVLSIQNHPSKIGFSKNEVWYFIKPPKDNKVIVGLNCPLDADDIENHIETISVYRGDVLEIPAGCPHALTPGSLVLELQEPLDCTYRIYDWGRGREINIEKAVESLTNAKTVLHRIEKQVGRVSVIYRPEFMMDVIFGPAEISFEKKGIISFTSGNKFAKSLLLEKKDKISILSNETAVWTSDGSD